MNLQSSRQQVAFGTEERLLWFTNRWNEEHTYSIEASPAFSEHTTAKLQGVYQNYMTCQDIVRIDKLNEKNTVCSHSERDFGWWLEAAPMLLTFQPQSLVL